MKPKKKILAISGSTRKDSSNLKLIKLLADLTKDIYDVTIFEGLSELPHFNPDIENPPAQVVDFRQLITDASGVLICTPEYIFSLPGSLKNAFEWCVSSTVFSTKPVGLITASGLGEKGHEELKLIMKTIEAKFDSDTEILISGFRGKINEKGLITDDTTMNRLSHFLQAFDKQLEH